MSVNMKITLVPMSLFWFFGLVCSSYSIHIGPLLLSITKKYSMALLQLVLVVATGTEFGDRLIFIVSFSICMYVCGGGLCQRRQSIFSFYQHNQSSKIVNCHNQAKQSREIYFKMQFT